MNPTGLPLASALQSSASAVSDFSTPLTSNGCPARTRWPDPTDSTLWNLGDDPSDGWNATSWPLASAFSSSCATTSLFSTPVVLNLAVRAATARLSRRPLILFVNSFNWARTWTRNSASSPDGVSADFVSPSVSLKFPSQLFEQ